jgi:hypothetical protein
MGGATAWLKEGTTEDLSRTLKLEKDRIVFA